MSLLPSVYNKVHEEMKDKVCPTLNYQMETFKKRSQMTVEKQWVVNNNINIAAARVVI